MDYSDILILYINALLRMIQNKICTAVLVIIFSSYEISKKKKKKENKIYTYTCLILFTVMFHINIELYYTPVMSSRGI